FPNRVPVRRICCRLLINHYHCLLRNRRCVVSDGGYYITRPTTKEGHMRTMKRTQTRTNMAEWPGEVSPMQDDMIFGQRVRQNRRELDLTQEDFAQRVGIATETVSKIERGERRPSKHVAERMAQGLRLS